MEIPVDTMLAAIGGCGLTATVAKYSISKALSNLDSLSEKITNLDKSLVAVSVRLEKLIDHDSTIKEHEKRIAYIEANCDDTRGPQRAVQ